MSSRSSSTAFWGDRNQRANTTTNKDTTDPYFTHGTLPPASIARSLALCTSALSPCAAAEKLCSRLSVLVARVSRMYLNGADTEQWIFCDTKQNHFNCILVSFTNPPPPPPKKNRRFKFCFKRCCLVGKRETLTWKTNEGRDVDGFVFADKAEVARLSFFSLTV